MRTIEAPVSDLDPFSIAFFDDPFPEHDRLREAGPVVRLRHLGCWGVARWQEVMAVFNDWQGFVSSAASGCRISPRRPPGAPPAWCWNVTRRSTQGRVPC